MKIGKAFQREKSHRTEEALSQESFAEKKADDRSIRTTNMDINLTYEQFEINYNLVR